MRKLSIAAAIMAAIMTMSVLFAYAEPQEGSEPAKQSAVQSIAENRIEDSTEDECNEDASDDLEEDASDELKEDSAEDATRKTAEETAQEREQYVVEESMYYYRTCLSEEEQMIYDALLSCCLSEDPSERGEEIELHMDPVGDDFHLAFRRSYNALVFDHPELFWLSASNCGFQFSYRKTLFDSERFVVAFQTNDVFPDKDVQMEELERAADEFLDEIDLTEPDPLVALAIHDKLIDLVTYDTGLSGDMNDEEKSDEEQTEEGQDESTSDLQSRDLGHTAYGALVENSRGDANTAVCDGYSYAYEYLLQKAGIKCLIITGKAGGTDEALGNHSWNLVELDEEWYEVDATWDDMTVEEVADSDAEYSEIAEEALQSEWYMDKLKHFMFNVTTEESSWFEPDESYRYTTDSGWVTFLGSSVHIRHTMEDMPYTGDYMTSSAPIAEGTQYAYEELID